MVSGASAGISNGLPILGLRIVFESFNLAAPPDGIDPDDWLQTYGRSEAAKSITVREIFLQGAG